MEFWLVLLSALLFYYGFAVSVVVYRQWLKGRLNLFNKIVFAPLLFVFIIIDILINYTLLVVLMGIPPNMGYTISARFEIYNQGDYGWKTKFSRFICDNLLDTIDPSDNHC